MPNKTRKNKYIRHNNKDSNAKKALLTTNLMKTCRAKKYQAVYGSVGGSIRSNIALFG
jgi:hypothetical protein